MQKTTQNNNGNIIYLCTSNGKLKEYYTCKVIKCIFVFSMYKIYMKYTEIMLNLHINVLIIVGIAVYSIIRQYYSY